MQMMQLVKRDKIQNRKPAWAARGMGAMVPNSCCGNYSTDTPTPIHSPSPSLSYLNKLELNLNFDRTNSAACERGRDRADRGGRAHRRIVDGRANGERLLPMTRKGEATDRPITSHRPSSLSVQAMRNDGIHAQPARGLFTLRVVNGDDRVRSKDSSAICRGAKWRDNRYGKPEASGARTVQ